VRVEIERGVAAIAAVQPVGAAAAFDEVIAATSEDRIGSGVAFDQVLRVGDAGCVVERLTCGICTFDVCHGDLLLARMGSPQPGDR
jgi:hypothetical protein